MKLQISKGLLLIILLANILSCKSDENGHGNEQVVLKENELVGKWNIIKANRNGKETKSLESGYFNFKNGQIVTTNIFGTKDSVPYSFSEKNIMINTQMPLDIKVVKISGDTMIFNSKMRMFDMEFYVVRDSLD